MAILNSLNAHSFPIFELILMIPVSKFIVHRVLSAKTYLSIGLLFPLIKNIFDITTAGDWDCVAASERLPALR